MKDNTILSNVSLRENVFLTRVYAWMTAGLFLTALLAWAFAQSEMLMRYVVANPIFLIGVVIAEFASVIFLSSRLERMHTGTAIGCFLLYSALTGITFSSIVVAYAGTDIISKAFVTAAAVFLGASIYGMFTKRQIRRWSQMLFGALFALIIATLMNLIFRSSMLDFGISIFGIVLFVGLTAWDANKIANLNRAYGSSMTSEELTKVSILGALDLYLDFINIFLYLVRIFARSRDN